MKMKSVLMAATLAVSVLLPLSSMALSESATNLVREAYDHSQALDAAAGAYRANCNVRSHAVATFDDKTADILGRMNLHAESRDDVVRYWAKHLAISSRQFYLAQASCSQK